MNQEIEADRARLIEAIKALGRKDKAVLAVVRDPHGEEEYTVEEFGMETPGWSEVLGVLSAIIAYVYAQMFNLKSDEG